MRARACFAVVAAAFVVACGSSDGGGDASGDQGGGGSDAAGSGGTAVAGKGGTSAKGGASGGSGKGGASGAAGKAGSGGTATGGGAGKGGSSGSAGSGAGGGAGGSGKGGSSGAAGGKAGSAGAGTAGAAGSSAGSLEAARTLCVDTINKYRKTVNLPPYTRWTSEEQCVDQEAMVDGMMNMPHHSFSTAHMCGGYGQNECPNYGPDPIASLPGCLAQMWGEKDLATCSGCASCDFPFQSCMNCPFQGCGHYLNMKSSAFTTVACGFWTGGWYAQDFQ